MALQATHPNLFRLGPEDPAGAVLQGLPGWFRQTCQRFAAHEAIVDGERRLTFAELATCVDRLAAGMRELGLGPGDVIAYQLPNWWEAVAIFLATLEIGATVSPLLASFRAKELAFTLSRADASALFLPGVWRGFDHRALIAELQRELPSLRHVLSVRDGASGPSNSFTELASSTADHPSTKVDPDAIALLLYTSGTTADPKGVLHTHRTLGSEILSLRNVHELDEFDRALVPSSLAHISGVIHAILVPALLGTSAVLMERWDAARGLSLLVNERVTYMAGAPVFLQDLVEQAQLVNEDARSLRLFSCGGAPVSSSLVEEARRRFPNCVAKRVYGSSEFPTLTTTELRDALSHGADREGRVITPAELRVVDEQGAPVDANVVGEVQARGPECFVGYLDEALNVEAFTVDGWFRTGDLGRLDSAGYLEILGRLKNIVIRKGEKISVQEIETAIARHPAVVEVAVVAVPDVQRGEIGCAVVRLHGVATLNLSELQTFLSVQGMAAYKQPERLEIVKELPRTAGGKIHYAELKERFTKS